MCPGGRPSSQRNTLPWRAEEGGGSGRTERMPAVGERRRRIRAEGEQPGDPFLPEEAGPECGSVRGGAGLQEKGCRWAFFPVTDTALVRKARGGARERQGGTQQVRGGTREAPGEGRHQGGREAPSR